MFDGEWHPVFGESLLETIIEATPELVGTLLVYVTHFGSVFIVIPLAVIAYLWDPDRFGTWLPAVFAYYGLMAGIKSLNSASRPDLQPAVGPEAVPAIYSTWYGHATSITTTSFPSGKVMVATLVVSLMVLDLRVGTRRGRALVGAVVVALVSYSRLGLGVHYPIDVLGGIMLAFGLLGVVLLLRRRFADELTAVFVLAVVCAAFAVWVRSNMFGIPVWADLLGSNRTIALGGSLGGLLVWQLTQWTGLERGMVGLAGAVLPLVALGVMYTIHIAVTHPLVTMAWAAVVFGTVIALPYLVPTRDQIDHALGLHRDRPAT